jgi:hypothetical protein
MTPFAATILPLLGIGFLADERTEHVFLAGLPSLPLDHSSGLFDGPNSPFIGFRIAGIRPCD